MAAAGPHYRYCISIQLWTEDTPPPPPATPVLQSDNCIILINQLYMGSLASTTATQKKIQLLHWILVQLKTSK